MTSTSNNKVFFIQPPWPGPGYGLRSQNRWPRKRGDKANRYPLYLCYAATLLKSNGFDVRYRDCPLEEITLEDILQQIQNWQPCFIVCEPATPTIIYDHEFASQIKKVCPGVKIIFLGSHVTKFPRPTIESKVVDVVVRGEFDVSLFETINNIFKGGNLDSISGISFLDSNGNYCENSMRPLMTENELDNLPFPDRELIPHALYKEGHVLNTPFTFLITARGCPQHCKFCLWPNIFHEHRVRYRSLDRVFEELDWLVGNYGMKEIFIDDGTFNIEKQRVIEFCKRLIAKPYRLIWGCSARVHPVDEEMLDWMKKSGCKLICYGPESANQETLLKTGKGITIDQSRNAISLTKKAKITCHANYMFGFPWEDEAMIEKTIKFALETDADTVQFSLTFPHPGSAMFDEANQRDWFIDEIKNKNWKRFEMGQGPVLKSGVSAERLQNIISRAHARFFLRPTYIFKQLIKIKNSKDALKLLMGALSIIRGKILFRTRN